MEQFSTVTPEARMRIPVAVDTFPFPVILNPWIRPEPEVISTTGVALSAGRILVVALPFPMMSRLRFTTMFST